MKKLILSMTLFAGLASAGFAQVCTPDIINFPAGAVVNPASLPCFVQGASAVSNTVTVQIPDSVDASIFISGLPANTYYLYVDSVRLDSITGAPAGVTTVANSGNSVWLHGGAFGCVQVSGSTNAAVGNYALSLFGAGCVHGTVFGVPVDSCQTGQLPPFINYSLSVCAPVVTPVCTPDSAAFTSGVYLYPPALPCITQGTAFSGTVSIKVPDSIDAHLFSSFVPANTYYLHMDSLRIDSITGMPAGISVTANPADSVWLHGGQYGCAVFAGTSTAPVGNYPIGIYGRGCVHGMVFSLAIDSCVSGSLSSYFHYSLNVCSPGGGGACTVDTAAFSTGVYVVPATLPCIVTGQAFAGQININIPASIDAHDFVSQIPAGQAVIYVDSVDINNITGYPAGISSISNPVLGTWEKPGDYACAAISGTVNANVTSAGNYKMTITGTACGHGTFPLIGAIDTCIANFDFSRVYPYSLSVCYPAGVTEITDGLGVNIYPNPNQGNFTVTVSSDSHVSGTLSVIDQLGRAISTQGLDVNGTKQIALELGDIAPGAYILLINTAGKKSVKQFIVR